MAKPKHDYDSEEFLNRLEELARKGYADKEIAYEINITPTYFSDLKRDSVVISEALARGRAKVNNIVRQRLLAVGLGGLKTKRTSKRKGMLEGDDEVMYEEETELPPNPNVLMTWLFNHDEEWREKTMEGKRLDVTTNGKDVGGNPLVFVSASDLTEEQKQEYIRKNLEGDASNNDTGS
ncbi:hypothetical protein D3C87_486010 [compost metagenome]